jgi:hypothetical protein
MANGSLTSALARRLTVSAVASLEASGRRDFPPGRGSVSSNRQVANPKAQRA